MNLRNTLTGLFVAGVVAGIVVACGGGGGGYGGSTAAPTYTVGGNITGASGTVTLKLNGAGDVPIATAAATPFTFATMLASGATYNVQAVAPNQRCTVTSGAGTMGAANVTNVAVNCVAQALQMVVRSAILTGAQQNPPVVTNASGSGGIIVDPATMAITGGITFSGLTPTNAGHHIHQSSAADAVIIGLLLAADGVTATVPPGTTLTGPQYTALLAGELYFNVHTNANLGGEIRGQINLQGGVLAGVATLDKNQEVPASTSTATGQGTLLVDAATRTILTSYITHNVANATLAHLHNSPTGAIGNGPPIVSFNLGTGFAAPSAGTQVSAVDVANFLANYLYFNVHSTNNLCAPAPNCGEGEIRGNIAPIP